MNFVYVHFPHIHDGSLSIVVVVVIFFFFLGVTSFIMSKKRDIAQVYMKCTIGSPTIKV